MLLEADIVKLKMQGKLTREGLKEAVHTRDKWKTLAEARGETLADEEDLLEHITEKLAATEARLLEAVDTCNELRGALETDAAERAEVEEATRQVMDITATLTDLEAAHQTEVQRLTDRLDGHLTLMQELRVSHATEMAGVKEDHAAEVAGVKEGHAADVAVGKDDTKAKLVVLNESYKKQMEHMMQHHKQALADYATVERASTKLEVEVERKRMQTIVDQALAQQHEDVEEMANKMQALLESSEADCERLRADKDQVIADTEESLQRSQEDAEASRSKARECLAMTEQLVVERETQLAQRAVLQQRIEILMLELAEIEPRNAAAAAKSETAAAAVAAARDETRQMLRSVQDLEGCIEGFRAWSLRARVQAATKGWMTEEEVDTFFGPFTEAAGRASEVIDEAHSRGFCGAAFAQRELLDEITAMAADDKEHDRVFELLEDMRAARRMEEEEFRRGLEEVQARAVAAGLAEGGKKASAGGGGGFMSYFGM
mmetsp:Transcript_27067/g.66384  ORF Transcript_27067/g.66384 Transcript_27067/m.66384 type:complete len:490 (+) Transcript_27067:462-1931(+)